MGNITEKASNRVTAQYMSPAWKDFTYHNLEHTESVVASCMEMARHYGITGAEEETLVVAAWFHDTGYLGSLMDHETESKRLARKFLEDEKWPDERLELLDKLIDSTRMVDQIRGSLLEQIIFDSDRKTVGEIDFFEKGEYLRTEWKLKLDKNFSDDEWKAIQVDFLKETHFLTDYARENFGKQRKRNLKKAKKDLANIHSQSKER